MKVSTEVRLLILGTRTFASEVADLVSETPGYRVAGFVENMDRDRCQLILNGLPVLWVDDIAALIATHRGCCAFGSTRRKRFVEQAAAIGLQFATIIHPSSRISASSSVGAGSILSVGSIVAADTSIGRHVIVNRGALIGHHTEIGDFVTIGPGANIAASCKIGCATYVGMGAIVLDHMTIGSGSVVAAGSVVTKNVPDHVQVVGVPAKVVKEVPEGK